MTIQGSYFWGWGSQGSPQKLYPACLRRYDGRIYVLHIPKFKHTQINTEVFMTLQCTHSCVAWYFGFYSNYVSCVLKMHTSPAEEYVT